MNTLFKYNFIKKILILYNHKYKYYHSYKVIKYYSTLYPLYGFISYIMKKSIYLFNLLLIPPFWDHINTFKMYAKITFNMKYDSKIDI